MSKINFNKGLVADDILYRISESTGIKSISKSSKVRLLSDILSEEISNASAVFNSTVDSMYAEFASGSDLDIKGIQYGAYRILKESVAVGSQDNILILESREKDGKFSEIISSAITLERGKEMSVGNVFKITLTEQLVIEPSDSAISISAIIRSTSGSGFSTREGQVFKVDTLSTDLGLATNSMQIRTAKAISIIGHKESDDDFRERVIIEKAKDKFNSVSYIKTIFSSRFRVTGSSILVNPRGSATMDIGFVTEALMTDGLDDSIESVLGFIEGKIAEVTTPGTDIDVYIPTQMALALEYNSNSENDVQTKEAIIVSFKRRYDYDEYNTVDLSDIEIEARRLTGDDSLEITLATIRDDSIGLDIYSSSIAATCPKRSFLHLKEEDVTRGE